MDATEAAALMQLGERELWGVDELPSGIDVDLMRCLDAEGFVEARGCWMQNQQKFEGDPTPPAPAHGQWCSPLKNRDLVGEWDVVLRNRTRDKRNHPYEVRVSERGRAELARLRRVVPATPNAAAGSDRLGDARDALFDAARKADRLAKLVEALEARYAKAKNPHPGYFYVPTDLDNTWGRTLDPNWTDHAPAPERRPRQEAIEATLALRTAVDSAVDVVSGIAVYMDSEAQSVDERWTTRTIGHLRKLRGAITLGHGGDTSPSALPMIRAGVPDALREHTRSVVARMEEVKSAIVAGVKPRTPTVAVSPDLLEQLQRAAAAVDPHAIDRAAERAAEKVARVFGDNGDATPTNGRRRKSPTQDDGDYRPAAWFRKGMADRLRQAASKKRKTKRVATRTIDGVVCYCVADARRWWPDDVPKEA